MGFPLPPDRTALLLRSLLDRQYVNATGAVVRAIVTNGSTGLIERRLVELESEAARLAAAGKTLDRNNPVVQAFMSDFDEAMRANQALVNSVASDVQATGINAAGPVVRQGALPGFTDAQLAQIGIQWNAPAPEAVNSVVDMISGDAWTAKLAKYGEGTVEQVNGVILNGMAAGKGPLQLASMLRQVVQGLPASNAQQLMRTLQLTAFREAQRIHRVANAHILEYQIRIATFDGRTCIACIGQHGDELPIEARIDDHHRGRCSSVTKVRGFARPEVETGASWFNRQPESRQRAAMGHAGFEAWKNGTVSLRDFVQPYHDDVFGEMIGTRSLKNILAGVGGEYDYIPARPDYLVEAARVVPGLIETGLDNETAMVMADFFGYSPEGVPIWSSDAVRAGTVDLFVDMRNIGKVDPTVGQVDLLRLRASGILSSDKQLGGSVLSKAERKQLEAIVSTNYNASVAAINSARDMRLRGAQRIAGGYQGDTEFVSAQDADNIERLNQQRLGRQ